MFRKTLLGLIGVAFLANAALAQSKPANLTVSTSFASKYIWNAFDRVEGRGLESGPVVQPRVEVQFANSPLRVHVGGSFVVNDNSELHETVYGLHVERTATPLTRFGVGYNYYDDRVSKIGGVDVEDVDGHEVWARLEVRNPTGAHPRVVLKHEIPSLDGADAYQVVTGGMAWSLPVVSAIDFGTVGVDVRWHTDVVYNTGIKVNDVEVVDSGFSAWQFGVSGKVKAGNVAVSPHVNYQISLKDAVNDKNPFWAGIHVALAF